MTATAHRGGDVRKEGTDKSGRRRGYTLTYRTGLPQPSRNLRKSSAATVNVIVLMFG